MKVIKIWFGTYYCVIAAKTTQEAKNHFTELTGEDISSYEKVPRSEWDKRVINLYEDNDTTKEPYKCSINDIMIGEEPQLIYTNDISLID